MDRLTRLEGGAGRLLVDDARFADQGDIGGRASIADRGFIGVHLDEGVVHPEPGKSREDMLDGLDLGIPLDQCSRALDGLHMVGEGIDDRLVRQVGAAELVPVTGGGRVDGEGDVAAVVQGTAGEGGGCG